MQTHPQMHNVYPMQIFEWNFLLFKSLAGPVANCYKQYHSESSQEEKEIPAIQLADWVASTKLVGGGV